METTYTLASTYYIPGTALSTVALVPNGPGPIFHVDSLFNPQVALAIVNYAASFQSFQSAAANLNGVNLGLTEIRDLNSPYIGKFVPVFTNAPGGSLLKVLSILGVDDGNIILDTTAIAANLTLSGSGQLAQYKAYAGVFLHELLHAVYGDHAWGNGVPSSITQVYNDPEYSAEAIVDGQAQIAVQNEFNTQGVVVNVTGGTETLPSIAAGSWVVSSSGTNISSYPKSTDPSNGLQYYTIDINNAPTNVYVVDPATYQYVRANHFFKYVNTKGANRDQAVGGVADGDPNGGAGNLSAEEQKQISQYQGIAVAGEAGSIIGSALGNALSGGNLGTGMLYSSLLGTFGQDLGRLIASGGNVALSFGSTLNQALNNFGSQFAARLEGSAIGSVSSLLTMELGQTLGLNGFAGQLFDTVGTTVLSKVLSNVAANVDIFAGFHVAGVVSHVSLDATVAQQRGLVLPVRVTVARRTLEVDGCLAVFTADSHMPRDGEENYPIHRSICVEHNGLFSGNLDRSPCP